MSEFYENPLGTRYASDEMKRIFSPDEKYSCWRKLWIALAESEKEYDRNTALETLKLIVKMGYRIELRDPNQ